MAEVIRVMELMAATTTWIPAKNEGKPVNLLYTLPVKFILGENNPNGSKVENDGKTTLSPLNPLNSLTEKLPELTPIKTDTTASKSAKVSTPVQQPILTDCAGLASVSEQGKCSMDKIFHFLYENLKYPQEDRDNNVEGVAYVQLTIGITGELSYELLRFPSETIKAELIRLFDLMKKSLKWVPAGKDNFQFVLPVKFVLNDGLKRDPELSQPGLTSIIADPSKSQSQEIKSFSVKPNPANEQISIELYDGAQLVEMYDANGKGVLSVRIPEGSTNTYTIDVSKLASGLYTVQLIGKEEKRVAKFSIAR